MYCWKHTYRTGFEWKEGDELPDCGNLECLRRWLAINPDKSVNSKMLLDVIEGLSSYIEDALDNLQRKLTDGSDY